MQNHVAEKEEKIFAESHDGVMTAESASVARVRGMLELGGKGWAGGCLWHFLASSLTFTRLDSGEWEAATSEASQSKSY